VAVNIALLVERKTALKTGYLQNTSVFSCQSPFHQRSEFVLDHVPSTLCGLDMPIEGVVRQTSKKNYYPDSNFLELEHKERLKCLVIAVTLRFTATEYILTSTIGQIALP